MVGIRISGQLSFGELFAPIFPRYAGCYWVTLLDSLDAGRLACSGVPGAEDLAIELDRELKIVGAEDAWGSSLSGKVCSIDLFPKYTAAVSEDWATIYGFRTPVEDPVAWLDHYYASKERVAYVSDSVVCFCSIDGAYWELYTRDESVLATAVEHLRKLPVSLESCNMFDCHGI